MARAACRQPAPGALSGNDAYADRDGGSAGNQVCVSSAKASAITLASRRTDRGGAQYGEQCAEATIRKAAALAVRNATPLPGTAYKLGLFGQQIVDVVQALAK